MINFLLLFLPNEKLLFKSNELEAFEIPELKFNKLKLLPWEEKC